MVLDNVDTLINESVGFLSGIKQGLKDIDYKNYVSPSYYKNVVSDATHDIKHIGKFVSDTYQHGLEKAITSRNAPELKDVYHKITNTKPGIGKRMQKEYDALQNLSSRGSNKTMGVGKHYIGRALVHGVSHPVVVAKKGALTYGAYKALSTGEPEAKK